MGEIKLNELVSVIIPTYKGAEKLPRAIDSILNQSYKPIEIIIVDDNEPTSIHRELTKRVISNYNYQNIKYIQHKKNMNGAVARNTGIDNSKGDYICFLDDDDFYLPERVTKSVEILQKNCAYDAVYCGVVLTNKGKIRDVVKAKKVLVQKDILLNGMVIGTGSNIFFKRKALEKLVGFDESFKRHQDLEFMLRLLNVYKVIKLDELLIIKATNSNNNIPEYKELVKVKELYFKKFKEVINALSEHEKFEFFIHQYQTLLISAIKSQNSTFIKTAVENLEKYRGLTLKEKILIGLFKYRLANYSIYNIARAIINSLKSSKNANHIDIDIKEFINKYS
jgi:glycosyltransferase involved in cell wall biosynthesis